VVTDTASGPAGASLKRDLKIREVSPSGKPITNSSRKKINNNRSHSLLITRLVNLHRFVFSTLTYITADCGPQDTKFITMTLQQVPSPKACIVGVGYVGESLLKHFGDHYTTIGFDNSPKRIEDLQKKYSHDSNITLTTDESLLATATHYLISVPTHLKEDQSVDMTHLKGAIRLVITYARPGCTIVIESSVSVGTTRSLLQQYQDNGIYCGMSPERVDPGRVESAATDISKIISGLLLRSRPFTPRFSERSSQSLV